MAAVGDNNFMRYIYRGEDGEIVPLEATHIFVAEDVTVIRAGAFYGRRIIEIICHERVEKISESGFNGCFSLRRVIMPGVKIVEKYAFMNCRALTDIKFGKLEIIKEWALCGCKSLRNISLPSTRIVESYAFAGCHALIDAKFSDKLERFDDCAFIKCSALERITIPLKDDLLTEDDIFIFQGCDNLNHVNLIEGELHESIAALHLEEWGNDMNEEIDSINQILPTTYAGTVDDDDEEEEDGEKAQVIRIWIRSVLRKIVHYQEEHQRILNEAATTLQFTLPQDIAMDKVLPFLALPSHTFEVGRLRL